MTPTKSISRLRGDPTGGEIDTNYGWLSVAKTRPVSYGWSDQSSTTLRVKVKPPKTSLALMVDKMTKWATKILNLENQMNFLRAGN